MSTLQDGVSPLGGNFKLSFEGERTQPLAHDISASMLEQELESLKTIGNVNVVRFPNNNGHDYFISFISEMGNCALLSVDDSHLTGPNAKVAVFTIQDGKNPDDYRYIFVSSILQRSFQINNLVNGKDYVIRLRSKNSEGFGDFRLAIPSPIAPMDTPSAPTSVSFFPLSASMLRISWQKPLFNGGQSIIRYKIQWSTYSDLESTLSEKSEFIQNIAPSQSLDDIYCFDIPVNHILPGKYARVMAFNGYAWSHSLNSSTYFAVASSSPPGPVHNLTAAIASSFGILVSWSAPTFSSHCSFGGDGGSPITMFLIEWARSEDFEQAVSSSVPASHFSFMIGGRDMITGSESNILESDCIYFIRVSAMNSEGPGQVTVFSHSNGQAIAVGPLVDNVPEPPTLDTLKSIQSLSATSLLVSWDPPSLDGGKTIRNYDIEYDTLRDFSRSKVKHVPIIHEKQMVEVESSKVDVESQAITATVRVMNEHQLVRTAVVGVDEIQTITTTSDDVIAEVQTISTTAIDQNEIIEFSVIGEDVDEIQLVKIYGDDVPEVQDVKVTVPRDNEIQLLGIVIENINTNHTLSCAHIEVGQRCAAIEESLSGEILEITTPS